MLGGQLVQRPSEATIAALHDSGIVDAVKGLAAAGRPYRVVGEGFIHQYEHKLGYRKEFLQADEVSKHDQIESARIVDRWGKPYGEPTKIENQLIISSLGTPYFYTYINGSSFTASGQAWPQTWRDYAGSSDVNNWGIWNTCNYGTAFAWIVTTTSSNCGWNYGSAGNYAAPNFSHPTVTNDNKFGWIDWTRSRVNYNSYACNPANNNDTMAAAILYFLRGDNNYTSGLVQNGNYTSIRCFASGGSYGYVLRELSTRPANVTWTWQWAAGENAGTWYELYIGGYNTSVATNVITSVARIIPKGGSGQRVQFTKTTAKSARVRYGIQIRAPR